MSGSGLIAKQWERFFKERIAGRIPSKTDSNIVVVYSNYESDKDGEYDYLIGTRVTADASVPPGMVLKKVFAGEYEVFTTEPGPAEKVVPEAWQRIWDLENKPSGSSPCLQDRFRNL